MVRVITQETYDEVVQENIAEFDMTPDEAIQEALAQFEAQTECNKDIARRVRAGKDGAYKLLLDLLYTKCGVLQQELMERDRKMIESVLYALVALMDGQPDLLDARGNEDVILATLKWTSNCCVKHEMNRQKLFAKNIPENLKLLLNVTGNEKLLLETLLVIRRLTLDDDIRHEFGKAHEHARELGAMMLEPIKNLLKENLDPPLVSELLVSLSSVLVRNELCAAARDCALLDAMARNYERAAVVQQASKLSATTAALVLKSIAALTLREPTHSTAFFENGAPDAIKNACWAIRNMVARSREQNPKYHELGIESLLNAAYEKFHEDFGFDIKSALRDLECDVKFDEQWTGKGVQMDE
ncbi:Armadillo repeat-containing protein [Operophtera brumata]|uniref:Armadillo repeat-containing protein n=1 Tax=Operophtera brumata TaxID=104452 RepID=A0A0L7LBQ8_OPEBR|nr:Armadillo repeat-containing protein [Operophtera brumata]